MYADVTSYGALGDGNAASGPTNDTAFHNALAWLTAGPAPRTLYIPPGVYHITTPIRPEVSDLTICGKAATLVPDPPAASLTKFAILVDPTYPGYLSSTPPTNVTIRDLRIEGHVGRDTSEGAEGLISVNGVTNCRVENVQVLWTGANDSTTSQMDGIAFAVINLGTPQEVGTSGTIRNCTVDNIPKAAFYAAQGSHDVAFVDCVARNAHGTVTGVGFQVTGSRRVSLVNCVASGNSQYGLFIAVNNPGAPGAGAAVDVQVTGGAYRGNGLSGIFIGSADPALAPSGIRVVGTQVSGNLDNGIMISSATDVLLSAVSAFENNAAGIWITTPTGTYPTTARVQVTDAQIYNNRTAGGPLAGVVLYGKMDQVDVVGGAIYKTSGATSSQTIGVGISKNTANGDRPLSVRVLDVDTTGETKSLAGVDLNGTPDSGAYANAGYVRLQASGSPEGLVPAPVGSEYVDVSSGKRYAKYTGVNTTGWVQVSP